MSRNLLVRVAFAVPAIAVTVAVLWRGGWLLGGLLAVLGVLGTREVYDFARRQGLAPFETLGYLGAASIPFAAIWVIETVFFWLGPVLALGALWMLAVMIAAVATKPDGVAPAGPRKALLGARRGQQKIRSGAVLFKYFRHIARGDLEALFPNVRVVMSLFDRFALGVPALVGGVPIRLLKPRSGRARAGRTE